MLKTHDNPSFVSSLALFFSSQPFLSFFLLFPSSLSEMDFSNPHAYPPFMDLLSSQQGSHNPDCSPHLQPSFQPSSSEVPIKNGRREGRRAWSTADDLILISAWLNTSKDPIVGNEQKFGAFWKRVADYLCSCPGVGDKEKRDQVQCKQRWGRINDAVGKFAGCYAQASRLKASGQSDDDIIKLANAIFLSDHKCEFTLAHAWRELRNDQKWCTLTTEGSEKRTKLDVAGAFCSDGNHGEEQVQPRTPGVKAAKGKRSKSGSKRTAEEMEETSRTMVQSMWVGKEKELSARERLSKMKILDTLIARGETLSEEEIIFKNKLMTDLMSGLAQ